MNARTDSFTLAMAAAAPAAVTAGVTAGNRQAALLLHTVSAPDRAWLLAQLSAVERESLEPLLSELAELGIPADRTLLQELALSSGAAQLPASPPTSHGLAAADARVVAQVLAGEPIDLVVRVLACKAWSWREAVLAAQTPNRRDQLRLRLAQAGRPDATAAVSLLDLRLIELVESRVAAARREAAEIASASSLTGPSRPRPVVNSGWVSRWLGGATRSRRGA
jgi:hypothetical protein